MKKRILLLLVAMIGMATSAGWAQDDGTTPEEPTTPDTNTKLTKEENVDFKGGKDFIFVYANGNPVTVTEGDDGNTVITMDGQNGESITIAKDKANKLYLFGGSKNGTVTSSKITVTNGTLGSVFGGGYGELSSKTTAEVTGASTIIVNGGTIHNIMGGGLYYSKVGSTDITITNVTTTTDSWVICGGLESGKTLTGGSGNKYPTFDQSTNTVGKGNLTITGGKFCYIGIGGTDGTQGYVKEATATISNAEIVGLFGNGSNGASDKVSGIITGCTFASRTYQNSKGSVTLPVEVASINRGHVKDVALTFNGCTFPTETESYVGGTTSWKSGYKGSGVQVINPGTISYTFKGCTNTPALCLSDGLEAANVEVTGAKVKVAPFSNGVDAQVKAFTLAAGNIWAFNDGMEIMEDASLANNGTLKVGAPDVASIAASIKAGANEIDLVSGTTYELTEPLVIEKALTLTSDGEAKATIKGKLIVEAENVAIKNLAFDCHSTGTNYWLKNAITLLGNSITVNGCKFTGSAEGTNQFVANGIVIFPKKAGEASYDITDNTFTNFDQEVTSGKDYWTSTALLLCDNTSITKKDANQPTTIPVLSSWDEGSLADVKNTFNDCFANYIHQTENSYVYDVTTNAKAVADGINSIEKGKTGTIVAKGLTNEAILAAVNTLKPNLEGNFIIKSGEGYIVANANLVSSGSVYVLSKKSEEEYELTLQTKDPEVDFSGLKASTIEVGQSLSNSILTGGKANVAGVFSWKEPAKIAEAGKQDYTVVFTPTDLISYNTVEANFTFEDIKQYYTVQVGKCANGHLEIVNADPANKYENGSTLTVKPVADAHYAFDKYLNEEGFTGNTYTVSGKATLTAEFKAVMRTITVNVTGTGSVSINGESKTNNATIEVQEGTVLTVQAVPESGQVLSSLTVGGTALKGNTVTVGSSDLTIAASFDTKPEDKYVVKVSAVPNGKINLYDAKGNAIASGSSVEKNAEISVVAVPDLGYELEKESLKNGGTAISDNKLTVTADATITATFTKQSFTVTTSVENGTVEVAKAKAEDKLAKDGSSSYEYGTELTATATANDGYKLLSLVVNGKEIPNGGSFVVTAKTTVKAVMTKLAEIKIDQTPQIYTYDGNAKAFVVKTTPAGISGFTVSYEGVDGTPTNAAENKDKAYKVTITRDADEVYAAVNLTINEGLVIKAAQMKGVAIPTLNESSVTTTNDGGTYNITTEASENNNHIATVTFTPSDKNFAVQTFYVPGKGATKCTYTPNSKVKSAKLMTRGEGITSSLVINASKGGTVKVLNGGVETEDLFVGQTVTLQAIPNTEYAADATWDNETISSNTKEIELKSGENKVSVTFKKKATPEIKLTIPSDMVYNGTPFAGKPIAVAADSPVKSWDLSFDGTPTDAGTYKIYASRMEDENYLAVSKKEVGTFTIAPKEVAASDVKATDILQGQSLVQSILSGTADTDGTFKWVEPNTVLNNNGTGLAVRFVPTSTNYSEKTGLTANVTVTKTAGVTLRTLNLTVSGQDHGTVSMTLDGAKVEAGATVTKEQVLVVTATANTGYEKSVKINGTETTTYTIGEEGNVEVNVAFTKKSSTPTPDPEEPNAVIDVTGVSLDATSKTLAIGESFALKATVKPANADNQDVSWSSSDATIASVDKDGNVKALKAGTCKITATTDDGGFTATCEITVATATGIDEILTVNRIYTNYGQIIVEPTTSLEVLITDMTGRTIYRDRTAEKITVPVSSGIYIVRLIESNRAAATKVVVK